MKKKLYIATGVLAVLAIAAYFAFPRGGAAKYDFRYDKVSKGDITMLVTATGTINAVTSVDVGTQVSGIISKLYADFNSIVKEGQIIAQLDTTFLVQSALDAKANLARANAQLADSKRALDREKVLVEKGLDPQINYDAALTTYESNDAARQQAEATLARAKINLAYATILAPINGVVVDRKVNVGQTVASSFSSPTLYTIANDLSKMQVLTTVDESDIGRISIGQTATFTVDAYPDDNFKGSISQIRLAPVSVQNVVNYTVVIDVVNDQLKLMPGMTANVKVIVAGIRDAMKVSNMALRFQPPGDIIDSTRLKAAMNADAMRGSGGADSAGGRKPASVEPQQPGKPLPPARQETAAKKSGQSGTSNTFSITNSYPQYEKSPYVPSRQNGRARVWILDSNGKLEPVFVRTGITDGKYTEIISPDLKPGDQIVMGILSSSGGVATQSPNPLTGGGQQRSPGGGGGFR